MQLEERISAFEELGSRLKKGLAAGQFDQAIQKAYTGNQWFTPENIRRSITAIADKFLDRDKLEQWLAAYAIPQQNTHPKTVAIVMAGNIPLVGWQDLMAVLITGHKALVRLSSKDSVLPKLLIDELLAAEPAFAEMIEIAERIQGFDAVIATGSANTNRYFEYYFGNYPSVIRSNRTSVAVLNGKESREELKRLGDDIFIYFGLGCRNVSKLFVPEGYDFTTFYEAIQSFEEVANHNKYRNNYEYHRSILLLNKEQHLDNGFLMLKEMPGLASPMASLYFEYYEDIEKVKQQLAEETTHIQCVVADPEVLKDAIPFGQTQEPELWDYADGVDTVAWLLGLSAE
jgi:hypothetical protein